MTDQHDRDEAELAYIKAYDYDAEWEKERDKQHSLGREVDERRNGEFITLEEHEAEQEE
jgi:hypothetical protein